MPFVLQWENLLVKIKEKHGSVFRKNEVEKIILDNVSGNIASDKLVAVMGPSGSGKSTLLEALSGRMNVHSGSIKINGKIVTKTEMYNISGYIHQHDLFSEYLTTDEHMKFMGALKLNKSEAERTAKIKNLLIDLGLEKCKHTILGVLSGGERRRLSLATQLINNPHILFCDEITTGLDSFSAMSVTQTLEAVAKTGKLILVTVHQPSSQLFELFNNLILFSDGRVIFNGSRKQASQLFESANLMCPANFSMADYYIKCLTIHAGSEEKDQKRIDDLFALFHKNVKCDTSHGVHIDEMVKERRYKRNCCIQFGWLLWRASISFRRNTANFKTTLTLATVTAVGLGVMFSATSLEDSSSAQNILGVFSIMVSELVFVHMYYVAYVFPGEMAIFLKEHDLYRTTPYYLVKLIASIFPICFLTPSLYLSIYFVFFEFLYGLQLYMKLWFVLILSSISGIALGFCLSTWFTSIEYFVLISVPLETLFMILSGIWIKIDSLPTVFTPIKYMSTFFFGLEAISVIFWDSIGNLGNCTDVNATVCYRNGEEVLLHYGFQEEHDVVFFNTIWLSGLIIIYSVLGYFGILTKRIFRVN